MVDSIRPLAEAEAAAPPPAAAPAAAPVRPDQKLWVKLPSRFDPALKRIELILTMFPGQQQMVIWCEREQKRIGARCLIHQGLIQELQNCWEKNVVVK